MNRGFMEKDPATDTRDRQHAISAPTKPVPAWTRTRTPIILSQLNLTFLLASSFITYILIQNFEYPSPGPHHTLGSDLEA